MFYFFLQLYHFPTSIFFLFRLVEILPFPAKLFRKNHKMTQIEGPSNVSVFQTKDKARSCVSRVSWSSQNSWTFN